MRAAIAGVLSGFLLISSVLPVIAVPPDREPAPSDPLEFPAGVVCDFAVRLDSPGARQTLRTFYDREGNPRASLITGVSPSRVTNLETGESLLVRGGSAVSLVDPGDGSFRFESHGMTTFYFFDGDVNPVGEGLGVWIVRGQAVSTLDLATNVVTDFEYTGTLIDACAELAN
jgi:hypothetical protein